MVVTLGQTLDRSSFWPNVDSSPSLGNQKAVVEETLELLLTSLCSLVPMSYWSIHCSEAYPFQPRQLDSFD